MSHCIFIATDIALEELHNPHYNYYSINEALKLGIDLSGYHFNADVDLDSPKTILFCDFEINIDTDTGSIFDGDADDNFALLQFRETRDYCHKPYGVYLEWNYFTEGRGRRIIEYIKKLTIQTNCVEIWSVWLGAENPKIITNVIKNDDLKTCHIKEFIDLDNFDSNILLKEDEYCKEIYYCLKILV